jgi:cytochrome c oxidase subunit 1
MFGLGVLGMSRRIATYPPDAGFTTLNLIASIGAGILGLAFCVFIYNMYRSWRHRVPAPPDPWEGQTLEWATSSPPPRFNFNAEYPIPRVRSYAPLLDLREQQYVTTPAQQGQG